MRFQDMVSMLSEHVREQVALEHQKTDLQLQFLLEPDYLQSCWESMSPEEKQVIQFFILVKGEDFLTYRELEQSKLPLHPTRFRLAMTRLQRLGLLFTLRRMWGELAYIMPSEIVHHFRKILVPKTLEWRTQALPLEHTSYHIIDDLLQVLNCVKRKPLELTKKGTLPKKTLKLLFDQTKINKELLAGFPNSFVMSPYDLHEAIFLDLLGQCNLLVQKGNELMLGDVEAWIHQPIDKLSGQLMDRLIRYLDLDSKLCHLYTIIVDLDKGQSYSLRRILQDMKEFAPALVDVQERLILPLSRLGFMQSEVQKDDLIFMWKTRNEVPQSFLYIQPNYEILVPGFAPLSLKWELLSCANLIKQEEMWIFKLNKNTAQGSLEKGKSAEDLIGFLQSVSQAPIPENVKESIREWERQLQLVSFFDARIMKLNHAELAQELEKIPTISQYLQDKLGDCAYIVHVTDWDRLVIELEKRGYMTGEVQNLLHGECMEEEGMIQFFKPKSAGGDYKVESIFPQVEDAIPELRQIPKMWISNFSRYHESTLRELIQSAIQLGFEVRMAWKGKEYRIQPHGLVNRHGYWTMISGEGDKKEQAFRLEEMDKIQLLVPSHTGKC